MGEKRKIGIYFKNNPHWTGGVYYILNLIKALNCLNKDEKPVIFLFVHESKDFDYVFSETRYLNLTQVLIPKTIKYNYFEKICNRLTRTILKKNIFEKRFNQKIDIIFPYVYDYFFDLIDNKVYWLPDFQDRYLPHFFAQDELKSRLAYQEFLAHGVKKIVFSSNDALKDFNSFFPTNKTQTFVLQFASVISKDINEKDFNYLIEKYKLPPIYFYTPNQFWAHKNHNIVIQAVEELNKHGNLVHVYFSGNENDYRNPQFFNDLKKGVQEKGLDGQIHFLGFIDRSDVFGLMKMSRAVIQPSLFEGWSTVVEDAKAINAFLLLSDIRVHREQVDVNAHFFNPKNFVELSDLMAQMIKNETRRSSYDYSASIQKYARNFMKILDN